eukprot:6179773-Pleurochrysis_carterae.AAC.2
MTVPQWQHATARHCEARKDDCSRLGSFLKLHLHPDVARKQLIGCLDWPALLRELGAVSVAVLSRGLAHLLRSDPDT